MPLVGVAYGVLDGIGFHLLESARQRVAESLDLEVLWNVACRGCRHLAPPPIAANERTADLEPLTRAAPSRRARGLFRRNRASFRHAGGAHPSAAARGRSCWLDGASSSARLKRYGSGMQPSAVFTKHLTDACGCCGQQTLVQDYDDRVTEVGVISQPLGTPRCTNPDCPRADLVGWSDGVHPRPQRG